MKKNRIFAAVAKAFLVAALLVIACQSSLAAEESQIRILHINDFHGFAKGYKPPGAKEEMGGIACLAREAGRLRKEKATLFLAAGDMIQGNNWANFSRGKSVIEVMNAMKFDAMVVGNHEFDFGEQVLKERISQAKFPILGANVSGIDQLKPFIIKEIGGIRVAVIGVVTDETPQATHPRNVAGLHFASPRETVESYLELLQDRADLFVVLSHIGYNADMALAKKVKGIDIIVGGHSHTKLERHEITGRTVVVQAWEHALALGIIDVKVKNGRMVEAECRLEEIYPSRLPKDPLVASIVDFYQESTEGAMNNMIGVSLADLDGKNVRRGETNLGNLVADIIRETASAEGAIINGGSIRASIGKGQISVGDVYDALPFDNYIVAVKMTGKQLWEALEHGVSGVENGEGRFPQVSGISFTYSPSSPAGSRVKKVSLNGEPIDLQKMYVIATNDFLAAGGDGYSGFGEAVRSAKNYGVTGGALQSAALAYNDPGRWLRDIAIEYIKNRKEISAGLDGRITEGQ